MKNIHFLLIVSSVIFFLACQNNQSTNKGSATTPSKEEPTKPTSSPDPQTKEKDILYPWVDKLNIREIPSTKGKTVKTIPGDTPLEFTGAKSENKESIVLRGVCYEEPWLKIITPDKTEGWVFGGAVRRKGEAKGNEIITEANFTFEHFGSFNLKEWKKLSETNEEAGDAEIKTVVYQKGSELLEISYADVFDYGYGRTYKLRGAEHEMLKERELHFSADAEMRELTETVKVYNAHPNKQYLRKQKIKKHHRQLNALPMMADGAWIESEIQK